MCINIYASTIAYLIGTITSIFLINNKNKEKIVIGYFILFYTIIQLLEALIYKNNKEIYSRLLLINLGLQGLVFILLLNNYITVNINYIFILSIIAIYFIYKSLQPNFKKATINKGMQWNFVSDDLGKIFTIMYAITFLSAYHYTNKLNYINKFGLLVLLTYIISFHIYKINPKLSCSNNKPSIWCLSSALIAPVMLMI